MKYHINSWPDWDEYYHEDNLNLGSYRYIRQTRDGMWWYVINPSDSPGSIDWVPLPEVSTLEEAADVVDLIWRML